jgi:transcription initiation factor TFIIF subunit beta
MLLSSNLAVHQNVPKEYELNITDESVSNTYVFTEQDLPGFKSRAKVDFDSASANMPMRLNRPRFQTTGDKDKNKRTGPYFKKAIPSTLCLNIFCGIL